MMKIDAKSVSADGSKFSARCIWIDLDNSPHVPFFAPIIKELENRGHRVLVTARDFAQVTDLINLTNLRCKIVGRHYGKNMLMKIAGVAIRASQLAPFVLRAKPALAVSHGSRAQLLLSSMIKVPSMDISDYEHATDFKGFRPNWMMVPELIPRTNLGVPAECVLSYPGIKEDVYVPQFSPQKDFLNQLGLSGSSIVVTLRPPASHAHYHSSESDAIFAEVMDWLASSNNVVTILLPRTESQRKEIRKKWSDLFSSGRMIVPPKAIDGLNLMWSSDLVISGGGTMNREAAALHLPVYSTFRGKIGAVDQYLVDQKRLILIESVADVRTRIKLEKRTRQVERCGNTGTLGAIVQQIESVLVPA